jgi:CRP-like cAMP-binding protein
MREHPIFKTLSDEEYLKVVEYFEPKAYKKDTMVLKEGEYSDVAFILTSGEVSIIKETIYKDDYIITDIKAGGDEFFGEVNLIDRGLVTSTIKAKTDIETLEIDHNSLVEMMDEIPTIAIKILWVIAYDITKHLRKADEDVITLFNAFVEVVEND